ncbi:MAG TPA: sigma-70 family RNA polymerase sigma factor [Burkholderiaceae bacterium]|nr:sigma-70 family RNA polymerase sigma factor [Burkholderiaceae bacterium]
MSAAQHAAEPPAPLEPCSSALPWAQALEPTEDDFVLAEGDIGEAGPAACRRTLDDAELAALVARICDQHEASLARLYESASGRVYGLVLRVVRNTALAEEVVEDVFWQVWREAPRFDAGRGKVMAWMLAIARSRAIDALRRQERVRAHEQATGDDDELQALADHDRAQGPEDLVAASQHHARLQALLAALEPLQRQLLSLAFFRGCTHEEIAAQTGLALGTVKSHIRRTLAALKGQLAPAFEVPPERIAP